MTSRDKGGAELGFLVSAFFMWIGEERGFVFVDAF
jgi:hypothetical protein